jgi:hypothetical protein
MQCSLDGFLAHWPLFWQRIQIADRPAYIAATTGCHATHKLYQPAAKLPVSGMAGFAAGSGPEPVSTLAGFEFARRKCRPSGSRWMPSSCAIRRRDHTGRRQSRY